MGKRFLRRLALGGFVAAVLMTAPLAADEPDGKQQTLPMRWGEEAILAALDEPSDIDFVETPLGNVVDFLKSTHRIEIRLDTRALEDVGINAQTLITRSISGIKLRSALGLMLRDLELTWTIHAEVLLITTPEEAETMLIARVYDVDDLVALEYEDGSIGADYDLLTKTINRTIQPETWDAVGGPGSVAGETFGTARVLVVRQTREVCEKIDRLLAGIRAAGKPEQKAEPSESAAQSPFDGLRTGRSAIMAAMEEEVSMDFVKTPLGDVVDFLKSTHRIEIQLDTRFMEDVGIGSATPVTLQVSGVTLRSALELMLRDLDLTWTIRHEVLLITTPEAAECMLDTHVYHVGDLIVCRDEDGGPWEDYNALTATIRHTVAPETWDDVGGPGSLVAGTFGNAKILVVRQTDEVHEQVAELFERLRTVAAKHEGEPPLKRRACPQDIGGSGFM